MQAGPPASSTCQAALGPALAPGATPCAQPKHQSSPFPQGGPRQLLLPTFLSTAPAAFSGLARALPGSPGPSCPPCASPAIPTPGCGNAEPGAGGGATGHPGLCHHTGDAARAKEPLDQAPPAAPSVSLGWLMASGARRDAEPQDLGAFGPTLGRGGRVTPALDTGWGDSPVWGRKAGPPPWVPFRDAASPSAPPAPSQHGQSGGAGQRPPPVKAVRPEPQKAPPRWIQWPPPSHPPQSPQPLHPETSPFPPTQKNPGWDRSGTGPPWVTPAESGVLPSGCPSREGSRPSTHGGCHPPAALGALCRDGSAPPARDETAADSEHPCPGTEVAGRAGTRRGDIALPRAPSQPRAPIRDPKAPTDPI